MIATGANNFKLLFSTAFLAAISITSTATNCGNAMDVSDPEQSTAVTHIQESVAEDTSFIVKAIKFHQQQIMLADIADKKITDTSLKRIVAQIRLNHQASLEELFKIYKSADSLKLSKSERNWNDSLIADRRNDLSREEEKMTDLSESNFQKKWLDLMLREYDHMIPEFEEAMENGLNEKVARVTTTALAMIKENRKDLAGWRSAAIASLR